MILLSTFFRNTIQITIRMGWDAKGLEMIFLFCFSLNGKKSLITGCILALRTS